MLRYFTYQQEYGFRSTKLNSVGECECNCLCSRSFVQPSQLPVSIPEAHSNMQREQDTRMSQHSNVTRDLKGSVETLTRDTNIGDHRLRAITNVYTASRD